MENLRDHPQPGGFETFFLFFGLDCLFVYLRVVLQLGHDKIKYGGPRVTPFGDGKVGPSSLVEEAKLEVVDIVLSLC